MFKNGALGIDKVCISLFHNFFSSSTFIAFCASVKNMVCDNFFFLLLFFLTQVKLGYPGWKQRYYKEKFGAESSQHIETKRKELVCLKAILSYFILSIFFLAFYFLLLIFLMLYGSVTYPYTTYAAVCYYGS